MPVLRSSAASQSCRRWAATGNARLTKKLTKPVLQIKQRPDQQPPVLPPLEVVVNECKSRVAVEHLPDMRAVAIERAAHVIDTLTLKPARIRGRKPLLFALGDLGRHMARHHLPQQ